MKKILKYILLVLFILLIQSIPKHEHEFHNIIHEASYYDFGYIEHICECGYAYKDQYVNPFGYDSISKLNKELQEEKDKNKTIYFNFSDVDVLDKTEVGKENYYEQINVPIVQKEKVYIVFLRFKGSI